MTLDENDLKLKKKEKKVKVNYPLFVKKSKSNMFKRAVKGDFQRKKKPQGDKLKSKESRNDSIIVDNSKEILSIPLSLIFKIGLQTASAPQ